MKKFILLAILLITSRVYSDDPVVNPSDDKWRITKNSPLFSFSAEFECKRGDEVLSRVIRTGLFCPRYYYDLFDAGEEFQARGITRAFSWGFFFPWYMEIDVWDGDFYLGKIEGKFFTKSRAKFGFYDSLGIESAFAYLNTEASDFVIVAAQDEGKVLADLKGKAYGDVSVWEMNFMEALSQIDPRVLKIFAAFVADYHSQFLPPPKEINHYYFFNNNRNN